MRFSFCCCGIESHSEIDEGEATYQRLTMTGWPNKVASRAAGITPLFHVGRR
jgi:hypothetical protein